MLLEERITNSRGTMLNSFRTRKLQVPFLVFFFFIVISFVGD